MGNSMAIPVIAGIAAGIVLIVSLSIYSVNQTASSRNPPHVAIITIPMGAAVYNSGLNFQPQEIRVIIGINNTVKWINKDNVPHTVTSDSNYTDKISGPFNTLKRQDNVPGGYMLPGNEFNFTFTEAGSYGYHGEPDPWLQGTVIVS